MKLFGIKACNSVKKACLFLENANLAYEFKDIKKLDEANLDLWLRQKSFNELINTAGTTAKKLGLNKDRLATLKEDELRALVLANPSLIKRPLIEKEGKIYIGKEYEHF